MQIAIFGTGYVGLVQGAVLADVGNSVRFVDTDREKIEALKKGIMPFYEPGLDEILEANRGLGRLSFSTDASEAVQQSDVIFIAVGTPATKHGGADLRYVLQVAETIGQHINGYKVIVNKSTVPVGTAERVLEKIKASMNRMNLDFVCDVVSNPEFLKEGAAIGDCKRPDRIIIGTASVTAEEIMRELYAPFNRNHDKIICMGVRSAELTKYAANCMLATKISFMNEMANLSERFGADIEEVRHGIGSDPRIGYSFIYPGAGYGGSCFPKDVDALISVARSLGYPSRILEAVRAVNHDQKNHLLNLVKRHYGESVDFSRKTFAIWGLSFKPQTDDMREATSRVILEGLWQLGARTRVFDPVAMDQAKQVFGHQQLISYCDTSVQALQGADALIICTEWRHFWSPDFNQMRDLLGDKVVFDGRNIYEPDKMAERGLDYYGIGRGLSSAQSS